MGKQVLVFRSFAELRRKALPHGFVRRADRRVVEPGQDKPIPRASARALAGELARAVDVAAIEREVAGER
jgi:hypothetical protein